MANFTNEEKVFIKTLVQKELQDIEKSEHNFDRFIVNSTVLSTILMSDKDIPFLAAKEKYHQFLQNLSKKL